MNLRIAGKNLDLGDALKDYALDRIAAGVEKYFSRPVSGQMSIEKSHGEFVTHCALHLHSGVDVQTTGRAPDAYASVDEAAVNLEKQLRRYKRRLKNHHLSASPREQDFAAMDYVIQSRDDDDDDEDAADPVEANPPVIAETQTPVSRLSVSDAVMQLDLKGAPFLIFRNATHDQINVVYRRPDGNIGWIDPSLPVLKHGS